MLLGPEKGHQYYDVIHAVHDRFHATESTRKSYENKKRRPLKFVVADMVILKVSPLKGVRCFSKKGTPGYIGHFCVLERIRRLVTHYSYQLNWQGCTMCSLFPCYKSIFVMSSIGVVDFRELEIQPNVIQSIHILDSQAKGTHNKQIRSVKV